MTLAETIVAFALLGVLIVVIVGIFSRLLSASAKSTDQTAARLLAHSVMEQAVRQGPPDWGVGSTSTGRQTLYAHDTLTQTDFVYDVVAQRLAAPKDHEAMGLLYDVCVTVTWWREKADYKAHQEGLGRLSTQLRRTVYIRL